MIMGDMFSPRSVNVYRRHNPTSLKQPELIFSRRLLYFVHCDAQSVIAVISLIPLIYKGFVLRNRNYCIVVLYCIMKTPHAAIA